MPKIYMWCDEQKIMYVYKKLFLYLLDLYPTEPNQHKKSLPLDIYILPTIPKLNKWLLNYMITTNHDNIEECIKI